MKRAVKIILWILLVLVVLLAGFAVFLTAVEYKPDWIEPVEPLSSGSSLMTVPVGSPVTFLSWNTGYGALDAQSDFVMDGGVMSTARSAKAVAENMELIRNTIQTLSPDMAFLQEVDTNSRRSYRFDEISYLVEAFPLYKTFHAANFNAVFVPYPFPNMMGKVYSGLLTLSRFQNTSALRYQLPGEFSWPLRVANLKRCLLVLELPTAVPGKILYAINVHLSAYDSGGFLRSQELEYLRQYILARYLEGNYVIVGGDWNSLFPGVSFDHFPQYTTIEENLGWIEHIPADFTPSYWTWGYDPETPTVRTLEKSYKTGENYTGIIDGFLLSPNIALNSVKTTDMQFRASDHQPVLCTVTLKNAPEK